MGGEGVAAGGGGARMAGVCGAQCVCGVGPGGGRGVHGGESLSGARSAWSERGVAEITRSARRWAGRPGRGRRRGRRGWHGAGTRVVRAQRDRGPEGGAEVCERALCVRLHSTGSAQAAVRKQQCAGSSAQAAVRKQQCASSSAQAAVRKQQCASSAQAAFKQQCISSVRHQWARCVHSGPGKADARAHAGKCAIRCSSGSLAVAECEWWVCGLAYNHPLRVAAAQREGAPRGGRPPHAVHGRGHTHQGKARRRLSCLAGSLCLSCLAGSLCLCRCSDTSRLRFLQ
jgi:hypothetical protein